MTSWRIYRGTGVPHDGIDALPPPPSWRTFGTGEDLDEHEQSTGAPRQQDDAPAERRLGIDARGARFQASDDVLDLVNAALYLRRPLFVTGKPGSGKSSLAFAVAHELKLGRVLHWMITTRVTLQDGLYTYDAIGHLQDAALYAQKVIPSAPVVGSYIHLGPLGTALLPSRRPRVLLIDEIDKSDIDLPNDLLNIFEEGEFIIPELARLADKSADEAVMPHDGVDGGDRVIIHGGRIRCAAFPFIVLTSNNERDFPPAFLRRCIRLEMAIPDEDKLAKIVEAHLGPEVLPLAERMIRDFVAQREKGDLATDQLLNAVYLATRGNVDLAERARLRGALLRHLSTTETL